MAKGEVKLYVVKRYSTDQFLLVAGRTKFEAFEALASQYPEEDADAFEFVDDSAIETVTGEFGGVAVLADTID